MLPFTPPPPTIHYVEVLDEDAAPDVLQTARGRVSRPLHGPPVVEHAGDRVTVTMREENRAAKLVVDEFRVVGDRLEFVRHVEGR